jgi:uncharacterized protein (TIGR00730 family)
MAADPSPAPRDTSKRKVGEPELDAAIDQILGLVGTKAGDGDGRLDNRDQLREILVSSVRIAQDVAGQRADRLDVKIANAALAEMRDAYLTFGPYRGVRKVTIFGSARTEAGTPLYEQTKALAAAMAARGWMVVTGAGPGIMAAGLEGAGRENALGAAIRLPFESEANELVDPTRLVDMRYFFTRKLALIRESDAFVCMPGGFGTLDETFELLTLLQTGKATPVPVVMLGLGQGFWHAMERFVDVMIEQGWVGASDRSLYRVTNDVDETVEELTSFYANHHSIRWVGDLLVLRMHRAPSDAQLADIVDRFGSYATDGAIVRGTATNAERSEDDVPELARLALRFNRRQPGRLRQLIDAINEW